MDDDFFRSTVWESSISYVENKIYQLQKQADFNKESLLAETKSSVGDKYETARAMLHLEKEKISTQLSKSSLQLQRLLELSKKKNTNEITAGSIFCIASNWYFLAVAIGKINVNGTDVFILSSASPFGKLALGMKEGQLFEFNRIKSKISKIL